MQGTQLELANKASKLFKCMNIYISIHIRMYGKILLKQVLLESYDKNGMSFCEQAGTEKHTRKQENGLATELSADAS